MKLAYLGGLTAQQFMNEYWQKKPLLVRQAIPGFGDDLTPGELAGLACEEQAQSRLVMHIDGKWQLENGPFAADRFSQLPEEGWSLLVQGVNHYLPESTELLNHFSFIPTARLDDLMVSYAPDGSGIGPHYDSYDVFLLQGKGKRLWRVSQQQDMELIDGAPLRILKNFHTEQEWILESGDMLYLPPCYAHWGIAVGECMTWSVGFRAPSAQELGTQFLTYLQDNINLQGMYADPDLEMQALPVEISTQMIEKVSAMLNSICWGKSDVANFLGEYLTEPKPHIIFSPPRRIALSSFSEKQAKNGVVLDLKSLMLLCGNNVFINGEAIEVSADILPLMQDLARQRFLAPVSQTKVIELLYQWNQAGYLHCKRSQA